MQHILFVCTGNTCRSSMAEAIFKNLLVSEGIEDVDVSSAGTFALPGSPATPEAVEALTGWGIDLNSHKARLLSPEMVREVDLVLTMTARHKATVLEMVPDAKDKVFTVSEYAGLAGDIPDPIGKPVFFYRQYAEEIRRLCRVVLRRFLSEREKN
ncbi:MAG TPA: low molecular weight protein arginine phosphatase [Desulfotomaculum sp.]|nr:low molecular weight protein arginine phosphatase [Desulfotomaculum sp.]